MSASWHSLLVRIGERCTEYGGLADAEDHVETCFGYLARDLAHSSGEILALLMQCVEELPHKDPLYGALVGLINTEDREFVAKVVDRTHAGIQEALNTDNCNKLRILTRFLTVLMCNSVVSPGSLIEVYEALVSSAAVTVDEDSGNPASQARVDFFVFCILASLPWGGMELLERVPEELERRGDVSEPAQAGRVQRAARVPRRGGGGFPRESLGRHPGAHGERLEGGQRAAAARDVREPPREHADA